MGGGADGGVPVVARLLEGSWSWFEYVEFGGVDGAGIWRAKFASQCD